MVQRLSRGERRLFSLVFELEEGTMLTADHDVILMVKQRRYDPNEDAIFTKRTQGDTPELVLVQANGPDPDTGEGNVAIVEGMFEYEDTAGLFVGKRARADSLSFIIEGGIVFPGGYYDPQWDDELIVENTVAHIPPETT